jgi:3-oxoacyl-[acyl-carrier protein] reductase
MARCLAVELGGYGITVNALVPGIVKTERTAADDPNIDINWPPVLANGRVGQPEDVAATALFMASEEAQQITGQAIVIDGGWVIHSPIPSGHPETPAASSQLR